MSTDTPDKHASLIAAHHARLSALIAGDIEALGKVVAEDMIFVSAKGITRTRPDVIASFKVGTMKIERMDSFDISTRIYGNTGILMYRADTKSRDGDVTIEGVTRSTTVYINGDGGWRMVSQHQSFLE
ncbi:MAG: nuclear transport factor 2 family protein [Alphaproteobacteria bacterium]|jgi:ketosteroid isomerase-like protein|nr:nuclear transport factor 2 family protein [Alphaproteobacteria bacterium]